MQSQVHHMNLEPQLENSDQNMTFVDFEHSSFTQITSVRFFIGSNMYKWKCHITQQCLQLSFGSVQAYSVLASLLTKAVRTLS